MQIRSGLWNDEHAYNWQPYKVQKPWQENIQETRQQDVGYE